MPGERDTYFATVRDAVDTAGQLGCSTVILESGVVPLSGEAGPTDIGDDTIDWTRDKAAAQLARRAVQLDRALDKVCRNLFDLLKVSEDVTFCLTCSRHIASVADPKGLKAVFDDLRSPRLGYWHDAALVERRGQLLPEEPGNWLQEMSKHLRGMTLGDVSEGCLYRPPGAGGVDYGLLASYVLRSGNPMPAVLELDPAMDPAEIPGVHAFLNKFGL